MTVFQNSYLPLVADARKRIHHDPKMQALLEPNEDPMVVERFLINFSSRGVQVTEPVEGWIERAGNECAKLTGLSEIANALVLHAKQEADHHLLMIKDARFLISRWNERNSVKLDADALMGEPPTQAMKAYIALHEHIIGSTTPYRQVGVELEIEAMSPQLGPMIIACCKQALGEEIVSGLSFIAEHSVLDIAHTRFNEKILNTLLKIRPDTCQEVAAAGIEGLNIYLEFLGECYDDAKAAVC